MAAITIQRNGPPVTASVGASAGKRLEDGAGDPVQGDYLFVSTEETSGFLRVELGQALADDEAIGSGYHSIPASACPTYVEVAGYKTIVLHGDGALDFKVSLR